MHTSHISNIQILQENRTQKIPFLHKMCDLPCNNDQKQDKLNKIQNNNNSHVNKPQDSHFVLLPSVLNKNRALKCQQSAICCQHFSTEI